MFAKLSLVLERVADGEVEGLGLAETVPVEEVARTLGQVGHVECQSPVDADDEEPQVVAQSYACGHSRLVDKPRGLDAADFL